MELWAAGRTDLAVVQTGGTTAEIVPICFPNTLSHKIALIVVGNLPIEKIGLWQFWRHLTRMGLNKPLQLPDTERLPPRPSRKAALFLGLGFGAVSANVIRTGKSLTITFDVPRRILFDRLAQQNIHPEMALRDHGDAWHISPPKK
jgi:hypothetical protein